MSEVLIDTNILVYVEDPADERKQDLARAVVDELVSSGAATLSVQCLNEFYRAVRWKLQPPLGPLEAMRQVERLTHNCRVLPLTPSAALEAMRACDQYSMAFWDSLIWAVAKEGGVPYLLTEHLDDGAIVEGVRFVNPFSASFDVASLNPTP